MPSSFMPPSRIDPLSPHTVTHIFIILNGVRIAFFVRPSYAVQLKVSIVPLVYRYHFR